MLLLFVIALASAASSVTFLVFDFWSRCGFRDLVASARWQQCVELGESVIRFPGLCVTCIVVDCLRNCVGKFRQV